jgi:hypothetical protein
MKLQRTRAHFEDGVLAFRDQVGAVIFIDPPWTLTTLSAKPSPWADSFSSNNTNSRNCIGSSISRQASRPRAFGN